MPTGFSKGPSMSQTSAPLTHDNRRSLQLYRRAAGRVHERLGDYARHHLQARILRAREPDDADLIPEADFIALLTSFRLLYADSEPTFLPRIANVLWRVGDDEIKDLVASFRENWRDIPGRPLTFQLFGEHFRPATLLDTWLNGEVFHQDEDLVTRVDALRRAGPVPLMVLQQTVRDLCFPILGIDNVCAIVLDEDLREPPAAPRGYDSQERAV